MTRFEWNVAAGLVLPVEERHLSNGLKLILQPEADCPVFTFVLAVPAGGRTEDPACAGVSHFLEHCYSLGSKSLGPRELDRIIAGLGGAKNAFTTYDYTAYHARLTSDALPRLLELEAERLANLELSPDALAKELDVVKEERRRKDDRDGTALAEAVLALAYPHHPYGRPLLGTMEDLDRLTAATVRAYFCEHYVPSNVSLILAGGFDADEVTQEAERAFGHLPGGAAPRKLLSPEPPHQGEQRVVVTKDNGERAHLVVAFPGPARDDADSIGLELLAIALAGSRIARLPRRLVRERLLATSVSASFWMLKDPSPFLLTVTSRPGVPLEQVEAALREELADVSAHGFEEGELAHARAQLIVPTLAQCESMAGRALSLTAAEMSSEQGWRGQNRVGDTYWTIPRDALMDIARRYLRPERGVFGWQQPLLRRAPPPLTTSPVVAHPSKEGPAVPLSAAAAPRPQVRPQVHPYGRRVSRAQLPTGATVLWRPSQRVPLVSISVVLRAGAVLDPVGREGLSALLAELLPRGTDALDEEQIYLQLARLGTAMVGQHSQETLQFRIKLRTQDLAPGLALLGAALRRPRFQPEVLRRVQQARAASRQAAGSPAATLARIVARRVLFPGHPYRWLARGTPRGIAAVTSDDLHAFHQAHLLRAGAVFGVAGAFDEGPLLEALGQALDGWAPAQPSQETEPVSGAPPAPRLILIDKPDQAQAHVTLVQRLFEQQHPDYFALRIFEQVLGNLGLVSRMAMRVRTKDALAYAQRAGIECLSKSGALSLSAATKGDSVTQLIAALGEETEQLLSHGVTQDELAQVRARMRAALSFEQESLAHLSTALASAEAWGLGPDFAERYVHNILSLSGEEVLAAARRHVHPKAFSTIVVANRRDVLPALERLGPVEVLEPATLDEER